MDTETKLYFAIILGTNLGTLGLAYYIATHVESIWIKIGDFSRRIEEIHNEIKDKIDRD